MCSIFGIVDLKTDPNDLYRQALQCSRLMHHRGPDCSGIYFGKQAILAHERLSIIDIHSGAQPLYNADQTLVLAVNGEIYNHQIIREKIGNCYTFQTGSDCEVILALYQEQGPKFLDELRGMFAFILYDKKKNAYLIGRDHIGIIPLYMGYDIYGNLYFASEMKALIPVCVTLQEFPPGHYLWSQDGEMYQYYQRDWFDYNQIKENITNKITLKKAFEESVRSHLMCDVPYGVLLSGGLDSSIILASIKEQALSQKSSGIKNKCFCPKLHSFSVGLKNSPDLSAASRAVASTLGTVHHEVYFTIQEGLNVLREVIYHIETYDITTVRASTPMYLMSRKIKEIGIKMVLSGEGADEIFGGYLYFHKAPNAQEFHEELVRKLQAIHMYDCLRVNKATSAWGVEARVPFLDKKFLDIAMRINPQDKMCSTGKIEKQVLRECFSDMLPPNIVWRQKEQFSDGVGYEWIDSLKLIAEKKITDKQLANSYIRFPYNTPTSKEGYLYREIFEMLFPLPSAAKCVPGGPSVACSSAKAVEWDASFKKTSDPSGRTVSVHKASY